MKLACPMCCSWSVPFADGGMWRGPDGGRHEMVTGRCERCGSRVLAEPSPEAVETARIRLAAARDAMKAAAHG